MPSPFPGMDPFLENHWGDVHTSLTTYARDQLRPYLPTDLMARVEEYVHLEFDDEENGRQRAKPDVEILQAPGEAQRRVSGAVEVAAAEPLIVPRPAAWTERWIKIIDGDDNRLVTVIEFLSPGNKKTQSQRDAFNSKQEALLDGGTSLVEIDLVREGRWALSVPDIHLAEKYRYPYRICAVRAYQPELAECYAVPLREPLPAIRIPLRKKDPDVVLDLQSLINHAWEAGEYFRTNYATARCPHFKPDDEAWIQERIAAWQQAKTTP